MNVKNGTSSRLVATQRRDTSSDTSTMDSYYGNDVVKTHYQRNERIVWHLSPPRAVPNKKQPIKNILIRNARLLHAGVPFAICKCNYFRNHSSFRKVSHAHMFFLFRESSNLILTIFSITITKFFFATCIDRCKKLLIINYS